jgi:hypothetical protein
MLFGMHRRGCGRLPDARILAPDGAGVLRRSKRFSSEKAWFRKALSSCDHTAILEKCIPAARTCGLRRSRPGFSVTIAGGVIPQQQDRVLELIVSL